MSFGGVCLSLPLGIKGRMWDVIVLIHDHYLSIYLYINLVKTIFPQSRLVWSMTVVYILYNCIALGDCGGPRSALKSKLF